MMTGSQNKEGVLYGHRMLSVFCAANFESNATDACHCGK